MTVEVMHALWFAVLCFGLGCATVGFFVGHLVKAERSWQQSDDLAPERPGRSSARVALLGAHRARSAPVSP